MPRTVWNSWFKGWTKAKVDRLEYDAAFGQEAQREKELRPLIDSFKEKLATLLAYKHMDLWPEEAKVAFRYAERELPHAAELYRQLNSKANAPPRTPNPYPPQLPNLQGTPDVLDESPRPAATAGSPATTRQ